MYCPKCGLKASENERFCISCGAALEVERTHKKRNRKKAVVFIVISVALILALTAFVVFMLVSGSEVEEFKKSIESRNYSAAESKYENMSAEDQTKANKWMKEYLADIEKKYYGGMLDYATSMQIVKELLLFDVIEEAANKVSDDIYLDNLSTIALEKAREYASAENWLEAYTQLQSIHVKYRLYEEVSILRTECLTNYKAEVLAQINILGEAGEISKLEKIMNEALLVLTNDREIVQAVQNQKDFFLQRILTDASAFAKESNYQDAIELLEFAQMEYDHRDIQEAINNYSYLLAKDHCEALEMQGKYIEIIVYLRNLAQAHAGKNIYEDLQIAYAKRLTEVTLETAADYAEQRQFEKAIKVLEEAASECGNSQLWNAIEEYKQYLPRSLSDCHILSTNDGVELGQVANDPFGHTYPNAIVFDEAYRIESYVTFYLGGRFLKLSGCFVGHEDMYYKEEVECKIYADGILIFESGYFSRTSSPVEIEIDITGVDQLRIEFFAYYDRSLSDPDAILDLIVS